MLWLLALVPILAAIALFASGAESRRWLGATACGILAVTIVMARVAAQGWTGSLEWSPGITLAAALTPISASVAILVPAIALPVLAYATMHEHRPGLRRLIALLLAFVGAMELLVIAADLLTLLIGWELVGASSWALIGQDWRDGEKMESADYAFLMTRFGDLGLFLAAMVAFSATGSFSFEDLPSIGQPMLGLLTFGIILSAASKSGQLPFSGWLFRAMAGPTSVSALLHAATMVAAGAYLLARLQPALSAVPWFGPATITIGLATALAGGVVALLQFHAKKVLAASTSAHFGLMFVATGAGYPGVAVLHLIAHACFKAPLFLAAGIAGERAKTYDFMAMGFGRVLPLTALLSGIAALALAGVPPLGAAWTKDAIVNAAGPTGWWLEAGVIVAGGLSAAYAARFQLLAFGRTHEPEQGYTPGRVERAALGLLAGASLTLSALWFPAIEERVAAWLDISLPPTTATALVVSILAILIGLLSGRILAAKARNGKQPRLAESDWLGLPQFISRWVTRPVLAVICLASRIDDMAIDAVPKAVASGVAALRNALAKADQRLVDRGIVIVESFTHWLSRTGSRIGEIVADGLPEGAARLVATSGRDATRLQTGLSHQYYAIIVAGAALLFAIMIVGG